MVDSLRSRLHWFRAQLTKAGILADIRGNDAASFVFAEHQGRAIEASWNNDSWWIEFWEADNDENAPPILERTISIDSDACRIARAWLVSRSDPARLENGDE